VNVYSVVISKADGCPASPSRCLAGLIRVEGAAGGPKLGPTSDIQRFKTQTHERGNNFDFELARVKHFSVGGGCLVKRCRTMDRSAFTHIASELALRRYVWNFSQRRHRRLVERNLLCVGVVLVTASSWSCA
jgi:hypothetical protein